MKELQIMMRGVCFKTNPAPCTFITLIKAVCKVFDLPPHILKGSDRQRNKSDMRIIAVCLMRENGISQKDIMRLIGRHRTTLLHYFDSYNNLLQTHPPFKEQVRKIKEVLICD